MAAKQESSVSLKLLIDDNTNRLVAAEAQKDFVDILFSFLTFPMGTIIRVTSSGQTKTPVTIGCMSNLYHSVQNLSAENWHTEQCKTMVLNPMNPLADYCKKLKMNIDDSLLGSPGFSMYQNVSCLCSSGWSTQKMNSDDSGPVMDCRYEGAFLQKGWIMFLISDDLQVRPASPDVLAQLVSDFGLSEMNMNGIREIPLEVSKEQLICVLARSLVSKSPLSDVFLPNKGATSIQAKPERTLSSSIGVIQTSDQNAPTLNLKVKVNKHTNEILFAEATDEFFDFLCSFLTISIGSMMRVLKGNSGLGCIDNLYTSVEELDDKWFGLNVKCDILDPRVAPHHNCKKQPLNLLERTGQGFLINPMHNFYSFSVEPSVFIVSDDLAVKPLSFASSFIILRDLKVPLSDTEEQVVTVGMKEALSLLKAALTSPSSALTNGLSTFLQKQKA